jgi:protein-tyrosine phosphatase
VVVGALRRVEPLAGRLLAVAPVRRRLHARALRAWREADEPLIVCQGNINRSPFAGELVRVASAGFEEPPGRPSPPRTVAAAADRGVDLSAHRSRVVDDALVARTDAIFGFDLQNLARLILRHPRAWRRAHLLGALAPDGPVLIADPHGHDDATLHRSLDQIERALRANDTPTRRGGPTDEQRT